MDAKPRSKNNSELMEVRVNKVFRIGCRIGCGTFGEVYCGVNVNTNEEVAIKLEREKKHYGQLRNEYKTYLNLKGGSIITNHITY
jgi:serine/threonine protein kinase